MESCNTLKPFILKIVEIYKSLVPIGKHAMFIWIPGHIGIHGNTVVDQEDRETHWVILYPIVLLHIMILNLLL